MIYLAGRILFGIPEANLVSLNSRVCFITLNFIYTLKEAFLYLVEYYREGSSSTVYMGVQGGDRLENNLEYVHVLYKAFI